MLHDVAQALFAAAQRLLGEPPIGHVAVVDDEGVNRRIVEPVHRDRFDVAPRAVFVPHAVFRRHRHARAPQDLVERRAHRRDVLGVHQLEGTAAQPLLERVAEQPRRRFARKANRAVRVQHDDRFRAVLDEDLEERVHSELRASRASVP
jgi:hypothetical protein